MKKKIYLLLWILTGCASDPFPTDKVYYINQKKQVCERYKIVDIENIKFKFDKSINFVECTDVLGFSKEDAGKVMSWARRNKKKLEECASATN